MTRGLLLAASGSNAGKTCAAIGLAAALQARGISVQAAKAGPDFIDAAWLARVTGRPAPNLDLFMGTDGAWRRCWERFAANGDFALVEGAMGLFDGDAAGKTSGAHLAQALDLPVLLLLNAKAQGQSIAAVVQGFLGYRPANLPSPLRYCGIICTHVASERHWRLLRQALEPVCATFGVTLLGQLPATGAPRLESRHLGLKQACECQLDLAAAGQWFQEHVDVESLLRGCACPDASGYECDQPPTDATIAVAQDEAFAFCYADLPLLLAELGARLVWFSPLRDKEIPPCDGLYLPGGYPELHGAQLSGNVSMRMSVRNAAQQGMPIYGECGGYMYLLEAIGDGSGHSWPMTGCLPGMSAMQKRFAALGYRTAWVERLGTLRGHEFHYAQGPEIAAPLWHWRDAEGQSTPGATVRHRSVIGSWVHLYPEGSRAFWQSWLTEARQWRKHGAREKEHGEA